MKKVVYLVVVSTLIEWAVAQIVAPMLGYEVHNIVFPLVLIGNIGTALFAHYLYEGKLV